MIGMVHMEMDSPSESADVYNVNNAEGEVEKRQAGETDPIVGYYCKLCRHLICTSELEEKHGELERVNLYNLAKKKSIGRLKEASAYVATYR